MIPDLSKACWRKSSYSSGQNGNCVELASTGALRDSKNPAGPVLRAKLSELLGAVKAGRLAP